ncbi:hypothetical protein COLO4_04986 [Corchorus olitorius]|uniref:Aminotransferase-like plant mobile domain-containing protein n=1 Tax=Corchorus olitorius TaxID=93759 RepID=A0A1R3KSB0_9ROSI|nr:hypothetical protein COLO4_04986 [Corchorus olitorius]
MTPEQSTTLFDSFTELITPTFVLNDKLLVFEEKLPLPQGFNRARYGSGKLLPAPLQFEHPTRAQSAWATWTREVLEDAAFSDLLRNAGVLPSIILSHHAYYAMVGITLEDLINLTLLPLHGANDLDVIRTFSMAEKNKHDNLLTIQSQPGALKSPSLKEWCQHFVTVNGVNSAVRKEAFVLAWLTIIFGAFPEKRIMMQLAPIAVRIAVGGSFPLAPHYLANLYHCLDLLVDDEVAGANSRVIYSCLDVYFLQMFLLEHYPRYAGSGAFRESVLKEDAYGDDWNSFAGFATGTYPAVCGWKGKRYNEAKVSFLEVMDEEKEFCWRPYIKFDSRQHWLVFYPLMPSTPADKTFEMGVTREDTLVFGAVYATGRVLFLSLFDHTFQTTSYPMHRVRRQFGLNQRVPSFLSGSDSWGDCIAAFQHSRNPRLLPLSRFVLSYLERNSRALIARAPTGWYAYGVKDDMPLPAGAQQPFLPFPPPISKNKDNVVAESSQIVRNPKGKQVVSGSQGITIRENINRKDQVLKPPSSVPSRSVGSPLRRSGRLRVGGTSFAAMPEFVDLAMDESETNHEDTGAAEDGGSSPTLGPSQVDPNKTVSEKRKVFSSSTSTTTKKAKTHEGTQSGVDVDINVAYEDIGTQAAEMNVGDTNTAHPIDLGVGDVLKDLSAAMHAFVSVEKTPVSSSASAEKVSAEKAPAEKPPIAAAKAPYNQDAAVEQFTEAFTIGSIPISCVDGDIELVGSTNEASVFSLKASQHPPYHDEDSEEEDENKYYVPVPDFGGYVPVENAEYSKEYAQSLTAKIEDDEFTADVTADNFPWLYEEMIRIGPGAIQVHSRVHELAKRLIKAFPNLYSKGKLGSSVIGSAIDLLCCFLYEMDETPLSNVTESFILKWSGPIKVAHQLGMQDALSLEATIATEDRAILALTPLSAKGLLMLMLVSLARALASSYLDSCSYDFKP